jgi:hypothetical protein
MLDTISNIKMDTVSFNDVNIRKKTVLILFIVDNNE